MMKQSSFITVVHCLNIVKDNEVTWATKSHRCDGDSLYDTFCHRRRRRRGRRRRRFSYFHCYCSIMTSGRQSLMRMHGNNKKRHGRRRRQRRWRRSRFNRIGNPEKWAKRAVIRFTCDNTPTQPARVSLVTDRGHVTAAATSLIYLFTYYFFFIHIHK